MTQQTLSEEELRAYLALSTENFGFTDEEVSLNKKDFFAIKQELKKLNREKVHQESQKDPIRELNKRHYKRKKKEREKRWLDKMKKKEKLKKQVYKIKVRKDGLAYPVRYNFKSTKPQLQKETNKLVRQNKLKDIPINMGCYKKYKHK